MNDEQPVIILPETSDKALCIQSEKPISVEGFKIVTAALDKIIAKHGKARILCYFKLYKGWDEDAIKSDMDFTFNYGTKLERSAFVNASEKFIYMIKTKGNLHSGEQRFFNEDDLQTALKWINE